MLGGYLLILDNGDEEAFISSIIIPSDDYWLGMFRDTGTNKFFWLDGRLVDAGYKNWHKFLAHVEPSGDGDCVEKRQSTGIFQRRCVYTCGLSYSWNNNRDPYHPTVDDNCLGDHYPKDVTTCNNSVQTNYAGDHDPDNHTTSDNPDTNDRSGDYNPDNNPAIYYDESLHIHSTLNNPTVQHAESLNIVPSRSKPQNHYFCRSTSSQDKCVNTFGLSDSWHNDSATYHHRSNINCMGDHYPDNHTTYDNRLYNNCDSKHYPDSHTTSDDSTNNSVSDYYPENHTASDNSAYNSDSDHYPDNHTTSDNSAYNNCAGNNPGNNNCSGDHYADNNPAIYYNRRFHFYSTLNNPTIQRYASFNLVSS
ncbi:GATA zinc finger domain-containing protein 15-like [Ptychodera flava]|uniref:GATA zinc finger domain-containing protein 15-like n=1 Tax=Ptychodera flava TaxID=63121 RepID=UPI00396A58DF